MDEINRGSSINSAENKPSSSIHSGKHKQDLATESESSNKKFIVEGASGGVNNPDTDLTSRQVATKPSIDTKADGLADTLTSIALIMPDILKDFHDGVNQSITEKIEIHLDKCIDTLRSKLNSRTPFNIQDAIKALKEIYFQMGETMSFVDESGLFSNEVGLLAKKNPAHKKAIVAAIILGIKPYLEVKQILIKVLNDLNQQVITKGITDLTSITEITDKNERAFQYKDILKKIFAETSLIDKRLKETIQTTRQKSNEKKLDALVKSDKKQKTASSSEVGDTASLNDFLDPFTGTIYDILPDIVLHIRVVMAKIDMIFGAI